MENMNEEVDAVIPLIQPVEDTSHLINSCKFQVLQNMNEEMFSSHLEFPILSVKQILSSASSAPSINEVIHVIPHVEKEVVLEELPKAKQKATKHVCIMKLFIIHATSLIVNTRDLWNEIEDLSSLNKPWLTIGDFTAVLREDEKKGGLRPLRLSMVEFNNCLHRSGLFQDPKSGLKFSWSNNRAGKKRILIENSWKNPLKGNPMFTFMSKLKILKIDIKEWNWFMFGNVTQKLKIAEEEVLIASLASDQHPEDTMLLNNLVTARGKLEVLTQQQKEITQHKSRVMWLKDGASNSKFFHVNLKIRQTQNMIVELENEEGKIIYNHKEIADTLVRHFEDKFKFQEVEIAHQYLNNIPKVVDEEDNKMMDTTPSNCEIKKTFFELNPDSAPGYDGFAGWFYRFA
ncbi:uncharacterized protein LOC113347618 [Papaver somniferum]|uniref:uncharacterized protein LOC113347618 n=1 Tax=Papaver somniferum TaxID=3469 RepID=UPI000E700C56|nr:uncharacterized protein LOC113347618 [Papaver somniferum]